MSLCKRREDASGERRILRQELIRKASPHFKVGSGQLSKMMDAYYHEITKSKAPVESGYHFISHKYNMG
jgi:hypothetical protein